GREVAIDDREGVGCRVLQIHHLDDGTAQDRLRLPYLEGWLPEEVPVAVLEGAQLAQRGAVHGPGAAVAVLLRQRVHGRNQGICREVGGVSVKSRRNVRIDHQAFRLKTTFAPEKAGVFLLAEVFSES